MTEPRPPIRVRVAGSVRFRLTVTVVLVVGLTLLGGGALLVKWVEATLVNDLRERNEQILGSMSETLQQNLIPSELLVSTVADMATSDMLPTLFDPPTADDQNYRSSEFFLEQGDSGPLKFRQVGSRQVSPVSWQGKLPDESESVHVARDVMTASGPMTLHAVSSVSDIESSVKTLTAALWLGLPVLAIGAGIMTWIITGQALAPVGVMTRRVRELSATTLDARVPVPPTDDEVSQLAQTMNEMLDRLQHASMTQRQFVSDASHELRSPVASIRAQLETALRYPDDVDWPSVARIVLEEDSRLEHLVGNLLAMARVEEGRLGPRGEVDLDDLVLGQAPRMTGVRLDLSGVSAGRVWGNADELTSVVRNLLDNGARYAASTVKVSVRETGPWVTLSVADDGPGIAPGNRERVFERFARLQEGRSRDQGGTGLGLALSRRIVEHHGGRIHVEDAEGGGSRFVVSLPSAGWTGTEEDHGTGPVDEVELGSDGSDAADGSDVTPADVSDVTPASGPADGSDPLEVDPSRLG